MVAIIEMHGKQYRVEPEQVFRTLQIPGEKGDKIEVSKVLATIDGDKVNLGKPTLEGAKVTLEIVRQTKSPKILVLRYQSKKNVKRTRGYRDDITYLRVKQITP
jgi:large subunit ribosomal protein L21